MIKQLDTRLSETRLICVIRIICVTGQ